MNPSQANVLIISDELENSVAQALSQQLLQQGSQIKNVTYSQIAVDGISSKTIYSHFIAVLPQAVCPDKQSLPLAEMVQRLQCLATPPENTCITYIQFGGGYFGCRDQTLHPQVCCAAGFARSLHLERPDLRVRVIDLDHQIESNQAAELVLRELSTTEAIATVGYDANLTRIVWQARLQQPIDYQRRSLHWSAEDVILVTGGGKGITAECAFAVAKATGVKMALVGRSTLENPEVAQTLVRFQAEGLTCRYYRFDVTNLDAVRQLVERVTADLGTITGVIHGAGLNKPRRVEQVSFEQACHEVSPKLRGGYNLLNVLAATPPKLIMAFSSIIGVTGMPGNAWYAFANESLDLLLRRFEHEHPQTQIISLAYSVWDEIGMGARMGSVKTLARMGIDAIPPSQGVDRFLQLFEFDPGVKQVIVAARLTLDTWTPITLPPPVGLRFIEQIEYVEPEVELRVRTHLSLERDPYVTDHIWRGSYLFPTVFGLEAMAQAIAYLTGEQRPSIIRIEQISLRRPVVVHPLSGVEIEIHAEVMEANAKGEQQVRVGIRTEQTGFKVNHFVATFVLGEAQMGDKQALHLDKPLALDPQTELYGNLLFQGPRFQQMGAIFELNQKQAIFRSQVQPEPDLLAQSFASGLANRLILGDPYFRDVLLQSVQLTIPQHICLPVEIDKIEFFRNGANSGDSRMVSVVLQKREDREYISEVVATDEQGNVVERLTGYRLRILEEHLEYPTAAALANPQERDCLRLEQVMETTFQEFGLNLPGIGLGYAPLLREKPLEQRRLVEQPIVADAIRKKLGLTPLAEVDFQIKTLPSRKPELIGSVEGLDLSLSHCNRYCLCVVDRTPQGCDLELITHRSAEDWVALLGRDRYLIVEQLVRQSDTTDRAGTRIWSAIEAIRKAFNGIDPTLSVVRHQGNDVLLKAADYYVMTIPIQLSRPPERMIAIVVPQPLPSQVEEFVLSEVRRNSYSVH